jgi:hypothetical protein
MRHLNSHVLSPYYGPNSEQKKNEQAFHLES